MSATTTKTSTLLRSVKRILGKRLDGLSPDLVRSLPLELIQEGEGGEDEGDGFVRVPEEQKDQEELQGRTKKKSSYNDSSSSRNQVQEDGHHNVPLLVTSSLSVSPVRIQALLLRSIRLAAEEYLQQRKVLKKNLQVPGGAT